MLRNLVSSLILLFLAATTQASIYRDFDRFTGTQYIEAGEWGFKGENVLDGGLSLSIVPIKVLRKNKEPEYRLGLQWSGPSLRLVDQPPTLILLIDRERFILKAMRDHVSHLIDERTRDQGDIMERAEFITDAEVITRIAHAKSAACVLYTAPGRLERTFGRANRKIFAEFVDKAIVSQ
jgi:hypothetical protein